MVNVHNHVLLTLVVDVPHVQIALQAYQSVQVVLEIVALLRKYVAVLSVYLRVKMVVAQIVMEPAVRQERPVVVDLVVV